MASNKILRFPAVLDLTGLSRSQIYNLIAEKAFPEPISLGPRAIGWLESELDEWIASRPRSKAVKGGA